MDAPRAGFLQRPTGAEIVPSEGAGVRVVLPRWTWWNGLPRRHVVVQEPGEWNRLRERFAAQDCR